MKGLMGLWLALYFLLSPTVSATTEVSLRDKIGQMLLIGFDGKTVNSQSPIVQSIQKNNIGGVILFDYDYRNKRYDKNIENPAQVKQLNQDLQSFTTKANQSYHRPQLPLLISVDYEGGQVSRLESRYGFPKVQSAADVGKAGNDEAESTAEIMARTLKEAGFNLNFAPLVDVNVNPNNPIIGKIDRSFSSDATTVAKLSEIYSRHFSKQNIQCAYKHFPGHGSSFVDSHLSFVDVTDTWQSYEIEPYKQLLSAPNPCGVIMTAHIVNRQLDKSGLPATLSHTILTKLLREHLHFKGVIITDDMQMKAISDQYGLENAVTLAINAGADMLIFGNNLSVPPQDPQQLIDIIEAKVKSGEISLARIDEAYAHILALKKTLVPLP